MRQIQTQQPTINPEEKLRRYGLDRLSDSELLAIIIGDENNPYSRTKINEVTNFLINRFGNLENLSRCSIAELAGIKNLGFAKASRIKAALEIGRRPLLYKNPVKIEFSSPKSIYDFYSPMFANLNREVFIAVLLDRKLNWISDIKIADGSLFSCQVNPRDAFSQIIRENPASVVFLHNHPTGDPEPSEDDKEITDSLFEVGQFLQIKVEDHIIMGNNCYYSFAEKDLLQQNRQPESHSAANKANFTFQVEVAPDVCCIHDFPFPIDGDE